MLALAAQYEKDRRYGIVDKGMDLISQGLSLFTDKKEPAATEEMSQRAGDNTALIIVGGVAAVAVLGVMLSSKKRRR
jgi:hypothetical protein